MRAPVDSRNSTASGHNFQGSAPLSPETIRWQERGRESLPTVPPGNAIGHACHWTMTAPLAHRKEAELPGYLQMIDEYQAARSFCLTYNTGLKVQPSANLGPRPVPVMTPTLFHDSHDSTSYM